MALTETDRNTSAEEEETIFDLLTMIPPSTSGGERIISKPKGKPNVSPARVSSEEEEISHCWTPGCRR